MQRLASRFLVRLITLLFVLNCGASLAASPAWLAHEFEHALEHLDDGQPAQDARTIGEQFASEVADLDHDDESGIPHNALHAFAQVPATLPSSLAVPFVKQINLPPLLTVHGLWADEPRALPFKPPRG